MKAAATMLVAALLALGSSCARSDWIQQTLVTVDVTGTWQAAEGSFFELKLQQQGSKVKGSMATFGFVGSGQGRVSGDIEGSLAGDVFRFDQVSGTTRWRGEMTVSGDDMSGWVRGGITGMGSAGGQLLTLRRVSSP